ncbi:MAG: hypothetical protein Q6358_00360 [Candidatus Brocadiales bacterium]|nr:hypothetical protein [Candidatus Brocadiales bacterium]
MSNPVPWVSRASASVYLFGAGASHPSLPLARGVSKGMIDWGEKVRDYAKGLSPNTQKDALTKMSDELSEWGTAANLHYSVDTLAKKLFLTNKQKDICRLKAAMSAYFMLQQSAAPAEQRYDSFFAAILEQPGRPPVIPDDVWLLSWNYDRQFERAYHQYCSDVRMVQNNITLCKRVIRLNGLLGRAINKGIGDEYNLHFENDKDNVFHRVVSEYMQLLEHSPIITFAFEKDQLQMRITELAALADKDCTLVIIGYSFPFFNRRFDKLVLDSLTHITKVFLQVLPEHAKAIESRMRSLRELPPIQIIDDREQFYVPYASD